MIENILLSNFGCEIWSVSIPDRVNPAFVFFFPWDRFPGRRPKWSGGWLHHRPARQYQQWFGMVGDVSQRLLGNPVNIDGSLFVNLWRNVF